MSTTTAKPALVRSELRKITSTRLWWGLLIGVAIYTAISAGASAAFAGVDPGGGQPPSPPLDTPEAIRTVYASAAFSGAYIFAMILGITGMTGEYRYQTITPTFLAVPRRVRIVLSKMAAHIGYGLAYGAVGAVVALVVGGIVISIRGFDLGYGTDRLWPSILLGVVAVAIWTLVGLGIGTLIRNQIAAILVAVFVVFLVEGIATAILAATDLDSVAKWLPTNASAALTSPGSSQLEYLPWWAGGLVLLGYAVVLGGIGLLLSSRRDVT
ncbi:MAG: ABC transporter permease subunit [Nocardioidaceae bacterium]|nr:ABC transporter permease subunit [Nocardioidaceae bacterium]NUS51277.1 ABC transporter permease subunit [Nocardioidaceae bacterium]